MLALFCLIAYAQDSDDNVTVDGKCAVSSQKNISPISFSVFEAGPGETFSIGEVVQIMARFPDGVCNLPDPADLGPKCLPKLNLAIVVRSESKRVESNLTLQAARGLSDIVAAYGLDYTTQPGFYDEKLEAFATPWLFYLEVGPGMSTRSGPAGSLDLNWIEIPKECNHSVITFNTSRIFFESGESLQPQITIDTTAPEIVSLFTTEADGNYTNGKYIDIVVEFSGKVKFSQQPDIFSQATSLLKSAGDCFSIAHAPPYPPPQVYLDARASGEMLFGVPYLELNSKVRVPLRGYGREQSKLSFVYRVGTGEETPPGVWLALAANTTINLNGATIRDTDTDLDADLSSAPPLGKKVGESTAALLHSSRRRMCGAHMRPAFSPE